MKRKKQDKTALRLKHVQYYLCYSLVLKEAHGFSAGFHVFSDFHCKTHGFFSVYFRFRKPASLGPVRIQTILRTLRASY
jgi:hypothetical protein